ncbi:hypothetical protein ILUMI_02942 [Ignelater luminosus]|uniref:Uncharacterized protein n=1 Tax=Ignelater luminosus TaxID=2038154 RepID=A0A8K0DHA0_IGNLU|nr:hypothetical protein ILUMI_02942 [Ignelater luminosus]
MRQAITAVICRNESKYKAARDYGLKRTTIESRIKALLKRNNIDELRRQLKDSGNETEEEMIFSNKYTSCQVFNVNQEAQLSEYIKKLADMNYGLNYSQIRTLAYHYAKLIVDCKIPEKWKQNKMTDKYILKYPSIFVILCQYCFDCSKLIWIT